MKYKLTEEEYAALKEIISWWNSMKTPQKKMNEMILSGRGLPPLLNQIETTLPDGVIIQTYSN